MKKGKFTKSKSAKRSGVKLVALVLVMALLIGGAIGGTLAWLTDTTKSVTNTFTASDIDITLQEHTYDEDEDKLTQETTDEGVDNYKMIPGWTIPKDPFVTVEAGSEDCWVFVKVEEAGGNVTVDNVTYTFDDFIDYTVLSGKTNGNVEGTYWTPLGDSYPGVYCCKVKNITSNVVLPVIGYVDTKDTAATTDDVVVEDVVLVKNTVTKGMMDAITNENKPNLTFTAYASQLMKNNTDEFSAVEAWANVNS